MGGMSTSSVRIRPPRLNRETEEEPESSETSFKEEVIKEEEVLVYETNPTSKLVSPYN